MHNIICTCIAILRTSSYNFIEIITTGLYVYKTIQNNTIGSQKK